MQRTLSYCPKEKVVQMHWWFQDGLVGWVWFFLAVVLLIVVGLGIMVILRKAFPGSRD